MLYSGHQNCLDKSQDFLMENNLLTSNQWGFRPNDSWESQLLSIVHGIFLSLDCHSSLEFRGIFLDNSKAFDRVWHEGLLYKIQFIGISDTLLKLIESFFNWQISTGSFEWLDIFMVTNTRWRTSRVCFRTTLFFNIHKWFKSWGSHPDWKW